MDSGYYKYHEAYHLLKFSNERQILEMAYNEYLDLKRQICGATENITKTRQQKSCCDLLRRLSFVTWK